MSADFVRWRNLSKQRKMKTEHTAGPWRVDGRDLFQGIGHDKPLLHAVIRSQDERWTALVEVEDEAGEANATLIASAPELLAALEAYIAAFAPCETVGAPNAHKELLAKARSAIAKAKGQP